MIKLEQQLAGKMIIRFLRVGADIAGMQDEVDIKGKLTYGLQQEFDAAVGMMRRLVHLMQMIIRVGADMRITDMQAC